MYFSPRYRQKVYTEHKNPKNFLPSKCVYLSTFCQKCILSALFTPFWRSDVQKCNVYDLFPPPTPLSMNPDPPLHAGEIFSPKIAFSRTPCTGRIRNCFLIAGKRKNVEKSDFLVDFGRFSGPEGRFSGNFDLLDPKIDQNRPKNRIFRRFYDSHN